MAAQDKVTFKQDLTEPVKIRHYEGVVFTGDDCGNLINVALFDGGTPYSGGGTVSATAVLADGTTFPLTQGSITGNMVSVPLEAGALVVSGLMGLYVKISGGGIICTVLNAIFTVQVTDTGRVPAATVTTVNELVQEIKDAQDSFPADLTNLLAAVAPTFSTSTAYSAGAYVWQGGKLYRFTAAHPSGTWTGTDAVTVALGDDVADLKSAIRDTNDTFSDFLQSELGKTTYVFTYEDGKAWYTSESPVTLQTPNNTVWKYCKIPCASGDVFHVNIDAGGSNYRPWAFVDASMELLSKASVNVVDTDITAPENAAYLLCNVREATGFSTGVHKVTKGTSRIAALEDRISAAESDINNNTEDVALALTSEIRYLKGGFERNAWRTDRPYEKLNNRNWKVCSSDYIVYPYDIELIAEDGYQFYFQTLTDENEFIFVGDWYLHYGYIPANTRFTIVILADPEDKTVIADPAVYKMKIQVRKTEPFNLRWKAYMKDRLHFIGHRGWRGDTTSIPENSIPAFQKAGQLGAWAIETDVRETSDGAFVIMHDETVDRTTDGTGNIADMTLAQVEALHLIGGDGTLTVPTFAEYLGQCKTYGCVAFVEIKALNNGLTSFEQVAAMIQKYGMRDYTGFIVHTKEMLDNVRRYFPEAPVQFMTESYTLWPNYTDYLNAMQCLGNSLCELLASETSEKFPQIALVHAKGLPVICSSSSWSAQATYLRNGVDAIMSNNNLVVGT